MTNRHILSSLISFILFLALWASPTVSALPLSHYTENSALSQGRWMKIRVDADGMYRIPTSTLRSWGFKDLSRVRVFGYGGRRISNVLSEADYIDDLPQAPCELTDRGLVFYGVGGGSWKTVQNFKHFEQNPYSSYGYYFVGELAEGSEETAMPAAGNARVNADAVRTFESLLHYEREISLATDAGPLMVGEDFRFTRSRTVPMEFTDAVDGGTARVECSFVANLGAPANSP